LLTRDNLRFPDSVRNCISGRLSHCVLRSMPIATPAGGRDRLITLDWLCNEMHFAIAYVVPLLRARVRSNGNVINVARGKKQRKTRRKHFVFCTREGERKGEGEPRGCIFNGRIYRRYFPSGRAPATGFSFCRFLLIIGTQLRPYQRAVEDTCPGVSHGATRSPHATTVRRFSWRSHIAQHHVRDTRVQPTLPAASRRSPLRSNVAFLHTMDRPDRRLTN